MTRVVVHSKVGPDGVLHGDVPMGVSKANREVRVIVEEDTAAQKASGQEDWDDFIRRTAGAWQGGLERPPQGELEIRDELP
jgi:hypothetical protein